MRRLITSVVVALGVAAGSVVLPASATADVSAKLWMRVSSFNTLDECESAGVSGERHGFWRSWWCELNGGPDFYWVLWGDLI